MTTEEQRYEKELRDLVELNSIMVDPASGHNLFRGMLLNRFPKGATAQQKQFYRDNVP